MLTAKDSCFLDQFFISMCMGWRNLNLWWLNLSLVAIIAVPFISDKCCLFTAALDNPKALSRSVLCICNLDKFIMYHDAHLLSILQIWTGLIFIETIKNIIVDSRHSVVSWRLLYMKEVVIHVAVHMNRLRPAQCYALCVPLGRLGHKSLQIEAHHSRGAGGNSPWHQPLCHLHILAFIQNSIRNSHKTSLFV